MTINSKRILTAVFVLAICGAFVAPSLAQETLTAKANTPMVIKYDGDMAALLANLAEFHGVTIGLEVDPRQPRPQVSIDLQEVILTDVLNAIIKSAPRYQWRARAGSIEVLPVEGSNSLLDTSLGTFQLESLAPREAIDHLIKLPEVQSAMRSMSLAWRSPVGPSSDRKDERVSIKLESVTLRQALNRVASASAARFWIFRRDSDGTVAISTSPR